MFLDISFIGGASYRKDGYSKIYNTLRRHKHQSICIEDSKANELLGGRYDCNQNCSMVDNLNVTLPQYLTQSETHGHFEGHCRSRLTKYARNKKDWKSSIFEKYNKYKAANLNKVS